MGKKEGQPEPDKGLLPIEELARNKKLRPSILPGLMRSNGWAAGKAMTEADFDKAVKDWLSQPVHGRQKE